MTQALVQFEANLCQANDLVGLAVAISASTTAALDTGDLLRSALVSSVSSLDHYVHEVVRELLVETALGTRPPAKGLNGFLLGGNVALRAAAGESPRIWMNEEVRRRQGHLSFQQPDKIADALRLVTDVPLWPTVAAHMNEDVQTLKTRLSLIVSRRNQIAHEADRDPTPPHERWPIAETDARGAIDLVGAAVRAIDGIV